MVPARTLAVSFLAAVPGSGGDLRIPFLCSISEKTLKITKLGQEVVMIAKLG